MLPRLLAFLFAVLILSVVDALYVRTEHWHRPFDLGLFAQSFGLWSVFVLLAAIPASFTVRILERFQKSEEAPWPRRVLTLIGWAAAPVAVHSTLDRHTGLYANLGALKTAQPWLEVAAVAIAFVFALIVFSRVLRRVSPRIAGSVTLLVLVVAIGLLPRTSDRFEPVEKSAKGKPNLLLLIWDTTRSQSLDVYGYDRNTTPGLAELAERCVLYEEARSVAVYTLTSHVTMLTGVYPSHHRARLTRMKFAPHKTPSIARMLQREGYRTGAFVGTGVLKASTGVIDGFEVYDDLVDPAVCDTAAWAMVHDVQMVLRKLSFQTFNNDGNPHWIQDFQRPADSALANALEWIENGDERPWFCMINMYDVHWPYLPAEYAREKWVGPYDGDMTGSMFRADHYYMRDNHDAPEGSLLTEEDKLHLTELYDAELFELDAKVKEFMGAIDFRAGNVGLVLTADHGEAFGEGGRYEHADILEPQVRIPMLVHPPNGHPREELRGKRVSGKASGVDVAKTLLGMAGIDSERHTILPDPNEGFLCGLDSDFRFPPEVLENAIPSPGRDLLSALPGEDRDVLVEDRDQPDPLKIQLALYSEHWKYVRSGVGKAAVETLFDLRADPIGLRDVRAEHEDVVLTLRARMDELRATWGADDEADARGTSIDDADMLQGLGYVGGAEKSSPKPPPKTAPEKN